MKLSDFQLHNLDGSPLNLSQFLGKKVLLVNVASECGLTPQYTELEELYQQYKDKGFVVLGVPCNDFGNQEPGSHIEIKHFCENNYSVTFPLTEKVHILGTKGHPLYQWLIETTGAHVTWNFQKFLIDENGAVVKSLVPPTSPLDQEIIDWIENGSH